MEIRQLRYFLDIARTEHLTQSAHNLFVTQSTLSHGLRQLEQELGVDLFDRVGRRLRLSQAGLAFSRPLKKCSSNAPGSWISKKRVVQTRLRSECEGHFGLFAGRFARFGRTYPMAHA